MGKRKFKELKVVINIKYTDKLINAVNKYNDNLESISQKILNLKIDFNKNDIEIRKLYDSLDKLSVINSVRSRRETEKLLNDVINEYGYMLETFREIIRSKRK